VWTLTDEDLPGKWLKDPCGAQVLPNGNIVIIHHFQIFETNGKKIPGPAKK